MVMWLVRCRADVLVVDGSGVVVSAAPCPYRATVRYIVGSGETYVCTRCADGAGLDC